MPDISSATPGRRLRAQRIAAGLTQLDVAIRAECSVSYVRLLEAGSVPHRSRVVPNILGVLAASAPDDDPLGGETA